MKFENTEVFNFEGALRGMRNPKNSWDKSDSHYCIPNECIQCKNIEPKENPYEWQPCTGEDISWTPYKIGEADMKLAQALITGGPVHSKFLRQIFVSVDITAPIFFNAELDTYKVGTVRNSCSFMHKGVSKPFTLEDFDINYMASGMWNLVIDELNRLRELYLKDKDPIVFEAIRQLLPSGYEQKFTWTANYEILRNIYHWRKKHRLSHWRKFCDWIEQLPYSQALIVYHNIAE